MMKPSEMSDEELTRAVAMEVMGLTACDLEIQDFHSGLITIAPGWQDKEGNQRVAGFAPLTNANHWWMVVERMRELGYAARIWWDEDKWGASFQARQAGAAFCESIGRAVCEAALAAVRGEMG